MAESSQWNRPKSSCNGAQGTKHQAQGTSYANRKGRPFARGLLAALVVVIGGVLAFYFICGQSETPAPSAPKDKKRGKIAEVEPAKVAKKAVPKAEEAPKIDPNARPTKVGEVVNGYVLLPSGRLHRRTGVITNSVANRPKGEYHIFKHDTDNEIACYLTIKPGEGPFGPRRYTGRFKQEFLDSLKTPIEITDEDTPYQAQLKRDVIDARKELKAALDRGEDIEQIILDTREELQDLSRYKMQVQSLFNETRLNECETEQDVEDLFDACNKMLEDKGIAPIKFGPITRRRILSQKENKQ